jgi:hypothetical protein
MWGWVSISDREKSLFLYSASRLAKVKVNFALEQSTKTQRGNRGIALFFP